MARMGMDVDQVEQAARQLKNHASTITTLISQLDKVVNALPAVWDGPDAQRFVTQWWPEHRQSLITAKSHIEGLGQSALNNAREQRDVSSNGGRTSGPPTGMAAPNPEASASSGSSTSQGDAANRFVSKWGGQFIDADRAYGAQCFDVFRQYSNEVVGATPGIGTGSNAASDLFRNYDSNGVAQFYDRIAYGQGEPQAGDIIVYGGGPYGHVALLTDIDGDNYSVLEQNFSWQDGIDANDPATVRPHTFSKDAKTILGYLRPKNVSV